MVYDKSSNGERILRVVHHSLIDLSFSPGYKYPHQPLLLPLLLLELESPPRDASYPRSTTLPPALPPPLGSSRLLLEWSRPISLMSKSNGSSSASYAPEFLVK